MGIPFLSFSLKINFKFINMSNLGKIIAMTGMMAAMAESNYNTGKMKYSGGNLNPDPEWKRKKCKTCRKCGDNCYSYNYKGHVLIKWSKPNYNACELYRKK